MFEVKCYVEDSKLGELFRRIAGVARNVQHTYIPNAEQDANGRVRTKEGSGNTVEHLVSEMKKLKAPIRAKDVKAIIGHLGLSPGSYGYFLKKAIEQDLVVMKDKAGSASTYAVK